MWRRLKPWLFPATIVLSILALPFGYFFLMFVAEGRAIAKFKENHPFELIEGKSSNEVVVVFGQPDWASHGDDGSVVMFNYYIEGSWVSCHIWFKDGRVEKMQYEGK